METHTGIRAFPCNNCSESFRRRIELIQHLRIHGIIEETFHCDRCFEEFPTLPSLKFHIRRGHNMTVKPCEICRAVFPTRELVAKHIKESHEPSICEICDKHCSTPSKLKLHEKVHFRKKYTDSQIFSCTQCSESFRTKLDYSRHLRSHGIIVKTFNCERCHKECVTPRALKIHLSRIHSLTKRCEICKSEFATRELVDLHIIQVHKPSICELCDKSFSTPMRLKAHEKMHYTKDELPNQKLLFKKQKQREETDF